MRRRKRANAFAVVAAVAIALGVIIPAGGAAAAPAPFDPGVHRLAGADRFETAVAISQRFAPGVPVLYVATGADFPDALSAASAAAHQGGPLLLTQAEALPQVVRAEVQRLAPQRIVIAGGESAVGAKVAADLATLAPGIPVDRVGGADRYQTGQLLIDDAYATTNEVFVATGRDFPDALAATAAAHRRGAPVLLVDGQSPSVAAGAMERIRLLQASTVRIAGGAGAVSAGIEQDLRSRGLTVFRHEGTDRYLTAAAINTAVFAGTTPPTAFLATGADFADALAGAALAGALVSPMFLTRGDCIPFGVSAAIAQLAPTSRVLLGGPSVVGDAVAAGTACAAEWVKPATGRITDGFGPREPICTPGGCTQSFHRGVDIGTGCSAPISAASAGRIGMAGWNGTLGNFVRIEHGSSVDTGYAHLANGGILVGIGQSVRAGQRIGLSGATGAATGCHLHFEVYVNGTQVDPVPFMSARGVTFG